MVICSRRDGIVLSWIIFLFDSVRGLRKVNDVMYLNIIRLEKLSRRDEYQSKQFYLEGTSGPMTR